MVTRKLWVAAVLVAGCGGGGDDGDDAGPEPALTAVGSWRLTLDVEDATPCPPYELPTALDFTVTENAAGLHFTADDPATTISDATATPDGLGTDRFLRVELTTRAAWPRQGNQPAYVDLAFQLIADGTTGVIGDARGYFFYDGPEGSTTCRYRFSATGDRDVEAPVAPPTPPSAIATSPARPVAVVLDAAAIYWTAEDSQIYRLARTGGTPEPVITAPPSGWMGPLALGPDASLYYGFLASDGSGGSVRKVARAGGSPETVISGLGPGELHSLTSVDGTVVYGLTRSLRRITPTGSEPIADLPGLPTGLTGAGDFLYTGTGASEGSSQVLRVPLAGGPPVSLAGNLGLPWAIAVAGDTLHITDYYRGDVHRVATGGGPSAAVIDNDREATWIAARGDRIYYASVFGGVGTVRELLPEGGAVTVYRGGGLLGMAADASGVFWFDGDRLMTAGP